MLSNRQRQLISSLCEHKPLSLLIFMTRAKREMRTQIVGRDSARKELKQSYKLLRLCLRLRQEDESLFDRIRPAVRLLFSILTCLKSKIQMRYSCPVHIVDQVKFQAKLLNSNTHTHTYITLLNEIYYCEKENVQIDEHLRFALSWM